MSLPTLGFKTRNFSSYIGSTISGFPVPKATTLGEIATSKNSVLSGIDNNSMFDNFLQGLGKTASSALISGVIGAGMSYYMDRTTAASVFGISLSEWQWDGLLFAVESVGADVIVSFLFFFDRCQN
jgi:hypothetical protein